MQKFNDDNMLTKFIKNLLHKTYVPTIQIWNKNKPLIKDFAYIFDNYIVRARTNWTPDNEESIPAPTSARDVKYFTILEPYVRNQFYKGITANYDSITSNYDAETHYYLGQYLRMIRDLDGINLMQYYNCWDGSAVDDIRFSRKTTYVTDENGQQKLDDSGKPEVFTDLIEINQRNTKEDGLKTLIVPIKFNTKYTIYLNSNVPFEICSVYYDNISILPNSAISSVDNYRKVQRCSMTDPYLYDGVSTNKDALNNNTNNMSVLFEDYLALLIQLPETYASGVVVLEGDYTQTSLINILKTETYKDGSTDRLTYTKKYVNKLPQTIMSIESNIDNIPDEEFEKYFKSIPALTKSVDKKNYAFSDRLIEYLLMNVITDKDEITQDIVRVQECNSTKAYPTQDVYTMSNSARGVWDRYLRLYNYDLVTQRKCPLCYDINGYVDKDTESIILRRNK